MKGSLCRLAETSFLWRDTAMRIRERFNPRAPCGARPDGIASFRSDRRDFNPRAPCGARLAYCQEKITEFYFNPRAPCGARHWYELSEYAVLVFQPTRPLRGATDEVSPWCWWIAVFQPTRPLRGATKRIAEPIHNSSISTHAPLAGRDLIRWLMPL